MVFTKQNFTNFHPNFRIYLWGICTPCTVWCNIKRVCILPAEYIPCCYNSHNKLLLCTPMTLLLNPRERHCRGWAKIRYTVYNVLYTIYCILTFGPSCINIIHKMLIQNIDAKIFRDHKWFKTKILNNIIHKMLIKNIDPKMFRDHKWFKTKILNNIIHKMLIKNIDPKIFRDHKWFKTKILNNIIHKMLIKNIDPKIFRDHKWFKTKIWNNIIHKMLIKNIDPKIFLDNKLFKTKILNIFNIKFMQKWCRLVKVFRKKDREGMWRRNVKFF